MSLFFTADLHLSHRRIIEFTDRPFASVAEMDEQLVGRWNAAVGPHDEVYVLGGLALGDIDSSLALVARLHGTKHLVAGNHDRCFAGARPSRGRTPAEWAQTYLDAGLATVDDGARPITLALDSGREVLLSHFPPADDLPVGVTDRYREFRPAPSEQVLLHGHVHTAWKVRRGAGLQVNVGVDVWDQAPVAEAALERLIADSADLPRHVPGAAPAWRTER